LLDSARRKEAADGDGEEEELASLSEAKKLRPGEIDPSPETKAARPDPVDMDEDEKEMLSEARARLANTQGKKAKRKAREKLLDEARRVAALQKRREMQAAGLTGPSGLRVRGLNYNVEIPFERAPVPGFHDTAEELVRKPAEDKAGVPKKRSFTPTRDAIEIAARRRDAQREKARQEQGYLPAALEKKLLEQQRDRARPLQLPAPHVTEQELDHIVKMGLASEAVQSAVLENETPASTTLRPIAAATPLRTFRPEMTPKASPYRDALNIQRPVDEPVDPTFLRQKMASKLAALPKPKNDFDIVAPELDDSV
jgi:pre-mRNA-splicing factor CDC5/CEF1